MNVSSLTRAHLLDAINNRASTASGPVGLMLNTVDFYTAPRHGFAFVDQGKVIAAWGFAPIWSGLGEAWLLPTKDIKGYEIILSRHFKRTLDAAFEDLKMHRIQAAVKVGFEKAHRLVEFLGMQSEGVMAKYGPDGADYMRYAKWKP